MTNIENPMENFISRLKRLDSRLGKEIKNITPYWWDNSLARSRGASQQAVLSIAKHLNLDLKSVIDENSELRFKDVSCCYKKAGNKTVNDLYVATGLVFSASQTIASITKKKHLLFSAPSIIRAQVLESGKPWVDLESLVRYCWDHGVPVIFLPDLPVSKKMDAVVQNVNGRPVIAITKKHKHESALLFLLAHEMGHIFSGHLSDNQMIIDESVNELDEDTQESEANSFALELLTGRAETHFHSDGKRLLSEHLAIAAKAKGIELKIDPGHIALNWAHTTNYWAIANKALNILYPEPHWENNIKKIIANEINVFDAKEDEVDYLLNLMKIEG